MQDDPISRLNAKLKFERRAKRVRRLKQGSLPVVMSLILVLAFIPLGPRSHSQAIVFDVQHIPGEDHAHRVVQFRMDGEDYNVRTKNPLLLIETGKIACVATTQFIPTNRVRRDLVLMTYCDADNA